MKRNISVFILLILLASSFKYRTMTRENTQPVITAGYGSKHSPKAVATFSLDAAVADLQKANLEMAKGNPAFLKLYGRIRMTLLFSEELKMPIPRGGMPSKHA